MTGFAFNRLMVVMNRSIPVAIATYRYAHVFYYDLMYDKRQKKRLELLLATYTAGIEGIHFPDYIELNLAVIPLIAATLSVLAPQIRGPWSSLNRYVVCMGREERLFLERNVFNSSEPDNARTHETIIQ